MPPQYVFIVGLPRTGSKLMVNILKNCQERSCHITPESFFLGRFLRSGVRQKIRNFGDMSIDSNVHKLVDDMYSGKFSVFSGDYWSCLANGGFGVDKETVLQKILNSDRSDKEIYTTMLQLPAEVTDNTILGDKSGPHLYRLPTLLEWFPEAKVIHTFRDSRAILASEHKKQLHQLCRRIEKSKKAGHKLQPFLLNLTKPISSLIIVLYITTAWFYVVRLHYKYKKLYPKNYYLSKFEDLVNEPEKSVRKLCKFLDLEFHDAMLNPPKTDSSFSPKNGSGFNKQTLNKWQNYLKPWMKAWLLLWGKKYLRQFGYIR